MSAIRTALITGSTDPLAIGFTAGLLLAKTGEFATILLSGRRKDAAESAATELQSRLPATSPTKIGYVVLDVSNSPSIAAVATELLSPDGPLGQHGGRLDVLINNAGISSPPGRLDAETMFLKTELTTTHDVVTVMATNVGAVVELTNALLPLLSKSPSPRIVNTSSARGSLTFASGLPAERTGMLIYNASKSALNMVTIMQSKNLPVALGNANLKVNSASPGHVRTPFNKFTGLRTPEQGAGVLVHLATLPDDGITGQLVGDHAPFSNTDGEFVQIPW